MSGPEEAATAAIKAADARREWCARYGSAEELFPAMEKSRADWYVGQLVIMSLSQFSECLTWWEQLGKRGRRMLCRFALLDAALADESWLLLKAKERARLVARFMWLRDWVTHVHPPMSPCLPVVIGDE